MHVGSQEMQMIRSTDGRSNFSYGMGVVLAVLAVLVRAGEVDAATPAQACAAAKQKAVSQNAAAKLKCYAKATKGGTAVDLECLQKADAKLEAEFRRAESAGGCTTLGDAAAALALVDDLVAATLAALPAALPTPTATPTATMPPDPTPQTTACGTGPGSGPELWVAPDASGGLGQDCGSATYASIQEAVSAATAANLCAPGSITTVNVCPGTYAETLRVDGPGLTIRGVGDDVTATSAAISNTATINGDFGYLGSYQGNGAAVNAAANLSVSNVQGAVSATSAAIGNTLTVQGF